uniref:Adenomatous polyposis coli N-terminal dimerisation domain-containing protein n=1 Tax=Malurus cyaneus samueli TaxID=2593467 RepID=A0A8C5UAT4_9PASS
MSGSIASYDQLVRQVEALKKENSHLRRELEDNSNHLSKLENETSDMKEVLRHLQGKLEQEARVMVSSGQTERGEPLQTHPDSAVPVPSALQMDISSLYNLKFAPEAPSSGRGSEESPPAPRDCPGELGRATFRMLEELDRERAWQRGWTSCPTWRRWWGHPLSPQTPGPPADGSPPAPQFSMQMDLIRQQLQFEAQHIRSLMEERFATADEMVQRAQVGSCTPKPPCSAPGGPGLMGSSLWAASQGEGASTAPPPLSPRCPHRHSTARALCGSGTPNPAPVPPQVEVVFWLLSMLATRDKEDMSRTLLAMSSSQESCQAMRKSGCLPLLVQILHDSDGEPGPPESPTGAKDARMRANAALHNIVFSQPDEGQAKKEMRVLHVLEQIRSYSETCWDWLQMQMPVPIEPQICQATCAIMKLSFDEEYRRAMNELGERGEGAPLGCWRPENPK